MRIDGVGSNASAAAKALKHPKPAKEDTPAETTVSATAPETESEEKLPGVLRLLQEGHFKGVADVRLRISHFEAIQAMESQHLRTVAAGGFESLNQSVEDQVAALKDSGLLSEEQTLALDAFLKSLQDAQSESLNGGGLSVQELIESFQAKLDDLMGLLDPPAPTAAPEAELPTEPAAVPEEPVVELAEPQAAPDEIPAAGVEGQLPPAEEPVAEPVEAAPAEPQPVEANPLQQLVLDFQASVLQALDDLQSGLTGTSALPPISEPSGNGKAYAKFLAIYESIQAGAAVETVPSDAPAPEEGVTVDEDPEPLTQPL